MQRVRLPSVGAAGMAKGGTTHLEQLLPWALLTRAESLSVGSPGHRGVMGSLPGSAPSMPRAPPGVTHTDVPRHPQGSPGGRM